MKRNKEELKKYFERGDKPTQTQYADLIDSYIDAKQPEGEANRRFVIDEKGEIKVEVATKAPEYTLSPISGAHKVDLLKDGVSVSEIDLTMYLDDTNLARLVSGSVDTNGIATFTRDDSSTITVDLSNLKDAQKQADFNQADSDQPDFIKNKPDVITYDERSNLSAVSKLIQSYSVTTYNNPSDIASLDFTQKKVYAIVNYNTESYVLFKKNGNSNDTPLDVANQSDICIMGTNSNALLERTKDISVDGFNVFKLKRGSSLIFTATDATRTVKIYLHTIKNAIHVSEYSAIIDTIGKTQIDALNVDAGTLNGKTDADFIDKNSDETIGGTKTFSGNLKAANKLLVGAENPIAGSLLTMVKEETGGTNNVGAFFDLKNVFSGTNSNFTYASVSRADYKGTGTSGNIYGAQLIGRNSGTGTSGILAGSYSVGSFKGSGTASNVYGALAYAEVEGSGTPNIKTVLGTWAKGELGNSGATIKDVFASYSDVSLIGGTVTGDVILNYLDLKFDSANQSDVSVNNLYYIKANNDNLPNTSGEAYFIKSEVALPSKLNGELEVTSYKLRTLNTAPTSSTDSGKLGEIRYTSDYIYVCTAANTWKRVALTTW